MNYFEKKSSMIFKIYVSCVCLGVRYFRKTYISHSLNSYILNQHPPSNIYEPKCIHRRQSFSNWRYCKNDGTNVLEYWVDAINKDELKPLEQILFPTMLNMVVIAVTVVDFVFIQSNYLDVVHVLRNFTLSPAEAFPQARASMTSKRYQFPESHQIKTFSQIPACDTKSWIIRSFSTLLVWSGW